MAPCTYSNLSHRYCHVSISTAERHLSKQPLRLEITFLWTLDVRSVFESEFSLPAMKSVLRILIYLVIIKDFLSSHPFVYLVIHHKALAFFLDFLLCRPLRYQGLGSRPIFAFHCSSSQSFVLLLGSLLSSMLFALARLFLHCSSLWTVV